MRDGTKSVEKWSPLLVVFDPGLIGKHHSVDGEKVDFEGFVADVVHHVIVFFHTLEKAPDRRQLMFAIFSFDAFEFAQILADRCMETMREK